MTSTKKNAVVGWDVEQHGRGWIATRQRGLGYEAILEQGGRVYAGGGASPEDAVRDATIYDTREQAEAAARRYDADERRAK